MVNRSSATATGSIVEEAALFFVPQTSPEASAKVQ